MPGSSEVPAEKDKECCHPMHEGPHRVPVDGALQHLVRGREAEGEPCGLHVSRASKLGGHCMFLVLHTCVTLCPGDPGAFRMAQTR
jgi:hypothetical protein